MPVAMVTGAGRGIGRETAVALARNGFAVGLVGRTRTSLEETARLVGDVGMDSMVAVADVVDQQSVHAAVTAVEQSLSGIDVLVNNAGSMTAIGPVWEVDPDDWWIDVQTSLRGAFHCCRHVIPGMIERKRGRIVNLTSYVAVRPSPYLSGYAAAKAGLANLTEALAASLNVHGITAFSVAPGFTDTELTRVARQSTEGARWLPSFGTGRVVGADQSAALIAWLAGGAGDALTGRFLHTLDDGQVLLDRMDEVRDLEMYAPRIRRFD